MVFEYLRNTLLILWLAIFPVVGVGDFLNTGLGNRIEVSTHFYQDVFAFAFVFTIKLDGSVTGGAGAGEVVEDCIFCCNVQYFQ